MFDTPRYAEDSDRGDDNHSDRSDDNPWASLGDAAGSSSRPSAVDVMMAKWEAFKFMPRVLELFFGRCSLYT